MLSRIFLKDYIQRVFLPSPPQNSFHQTQDKEKPNFPVQTKSYYTSFTNSLSTSRRDCVSDMTRLKKCRVAGEAEIGYQLNALSCRKGINFKSTNSNTKIEMGRDRSCECILLAALFSRPAGFFWILRQLVYLRPCALRLQAYS